MSNGEFAAKAVLVIVMAVADLVFTNGVFVVAMFFRKMLFKVPQGVHRRAEHRK